jgi:hypothetical protein
MPRVPITQGNTVGLIDRPVAAVKPVRLSDGLGAGLQEAGQVLGRAAEVQDQIQQSYDNAAVKQAYNVYSEKSRDLLHTSADAYYGKQGFNAGDALKPTQDALLRARDEVRASLKNDRQRRGFDEVMAARINTDLTGIHDYASKQNLVEASRQDVALQSNSADDALAHVDQPELYDHYVATGLNAIDDQAKREGWAPDTIKAAKLRYQSGIALKVVDGKMTADPVGAAEYLHAHADEFTFDDRVKAEKALYQPMMERQSVSDVDSLISGQTSAAVDAEAPSSKPSVARMVAITQFSESRGREYDDKGNVLTSSEGARGSMQVMPGTQLDPGFGVKPAAADTPAERSRVGRDYLSAMMTRYGGDPAKAWAAYNWGPGHLDDAIARYGDQWLDHAPKETRAYVASNMAMLGGAKTYAPRRDDLNALYAEIDAQPWDFERKKMARAELDKRVARDDHLLARQQQDARDQAFTVINGLGDGFTSVSQIPADVRRNLSPEDLHSLTTQAERNVKGSAPKPDGEAITNLHELAQTDPDAFKRQDLRTLKPYMTDAEFDEINTLQAKMRAKPKPEAQIAHSRLWQTINFYGRDIGIDMSAKKKGESDKVFAARREKGMALYTIVNNYLRLIPDVAAGKRAPTDDEIKAAYDNAVMPARQADGTVAPRFLNPDLPTNSVAVPKDIHDSIQARLRAANLPSDDQTVARVYMTGQMGG